MGKAKLFAVVIVLVTLLGVDGTHGQCGESWMALGVATPGARSELPMCYDEARGRLVVFGGGTPGGIADDMWEYDGRTWTQIVVAGPSARSGHAMVYDSCRQKIVLFGGTGVAGLMNDTWEWDGQSWSLVATVGPPARFYFAMAFDASRGTVVINGGDEVLPGTPPHLDDTWEWDGVTWALVSSAETPGPRAYHKMVYDSARQRVVLFGGQPAPYGAALGDTWELGPTGWTLVSAGGPSARTRFGMCYDPVRRRTVLFGGHVIFNTYFNDTWYWDGAAWVDAGISGPTTRGSAALAFCGATGSIMLYGGNVQSTFMDDIWDLGPNPYDGNRTGDINVTDLLSLLAGWGVCP